VTTSKIAIVGDHNPELLSHAALDEAVSRLPYGITAQWVATDEVDDGSAQLRGVDGIWVAPGGPYRSFEGALGAIRHARETGTPLFGT
jgi:CTP synthase (UTP-ammonia lyase)